MSQIHSAEQIEIGKSKMYDTSEYAFVCVTNFRFVVNAVGQWNLNAYIQDNSFKREWAANAAMG